MKRLFLLCTVLMMACTATVTAADTTEPIFETHQSVSPSTEEWKFNVPPFSVEHQVRLNLEARIDWKNLAGSNPWLRVAVNGNFLTKEHLLNKRDEFKVQSGVDLTWAAGDRWRILYSPNFEDAIKNVDDRMAAPKDDPYHYVWDITKLVKPGGNTLQLVNLKVLAEPTTMVFRNVHVEVGAAIHPPADEEVKPAPTGPLSRFVATGRQKVPMKVNPRDYGTFDLTVNGQFLEFMTRTSLPDGKWRDPVRTGLFDAPDNTIRNGQSSKTGWKTSFYTVKRNIKVLDDHIHIADTFTNPGKELVGVIVQHHLKYSATRNDKGDLKYVMPTTLRVAGREVAPGAVSRLSIAEHPSVYAQWAKGGVGLIAEDDVFRVHVQSFSEEKGIGIADDQLGIAPGASVTLEWNVYPTPKTETTNGDYWDFVNAVRRDWDSNFAIPGPFAFSGHFFKNETAEWYGNWIRSRELKITCGGIAQYPDGKYAHGTGIMFAPQWVAQNRDWTQKMLKAAPDVKVLAYFHGQCSTEPGGEEKYADSGLINDKGEHLGYPFEYRLPLYLPTRENSYGKALWGYIHTCLDDIGTSGLYWDEMSHSVLEYTEQAAWDGCSVVINPETHAIIRKRTNVQLAMQPLQLDIAHYLRDHGKFLMANTQPVTRTMLAEKMVRFVETQSYQSIIDTHFGCPLGLGNHHPELTQADAARQVRRFLDFGGLYYGHLSDRQPPAWVFVKTMYPITPVELHEGYVLGAERIHTARSGQFGWPDGSAADVYVVDANGDRVTNPQVKDVGVKGRHLYEIRMPSDQFAVLVKKGK